MENGGGGVVLLVVALVGWFVFGDPPKTVANFWWPAVAAPWETVDAFYYPDRSNLYLVQQQAGLASVNACRDWANGAAYAHGDPGMARSDWECGLGKPRAWGDLKVYRATVK